MSEYESVRVSSTAVPSPDVPSPDFPFVIPVASSADQYHFKVDDPYTPRPDQAGPLAENLPSKFWGSTPYEYVQWFNGLWVKGDPSRWGPFVFTPEAVMIDPTGRSIGAKEAASDFLLLFHYFPQLRGEVVSWANNDTEIAINWRFVIDDQVVPVIDKFSFINGLVSFRQAYFDTTMLLAYLAEKFGAAQLADYFLDRFWRTQTRGSGLLFVPSLIKAIVKGMFVWTDIPLEPPTNLRATPGANSIRLEWDPNPIAHSYTLKRSTDRNAPFGWIAPFHGETSFEDTNVEPGVTYYYSVCCNTRAHQLLPQVASTPRIRVRR